jgi:hypothetical protein
MSNKNSAVINLYDYSESGIDVISFKDFSKKTRMTKNDETIYKTSCISAREIVVNKTVFTRFLILKMS